jgi:Rha family phage regulatory protein
VRFEIEPSQRGSSPTTLTTDSRRVAKHFKKSHKNVLQACDRLECSEEFRRLNFQPTVETRANPSGGAPIPSRVIQMTKDGFVMLVMGFTGKEAMKTKEAYINAFNSMAEQLQRIGNSLSSINQSFTGISHR